MVQEIIEKIQQLTDYELEEVMKAIENRYAVRYPEWEVMYLAIHREPEQRRKEVEWMIEILKKTLP